MLGRSWVGQGLLVCLMPARWICELSKTVSPRYPLFQVRRMLGPGAGVFISVVAFAFLFGR